MKDNEFVGRVRGRGCVQGGIAFTNHVWHIQTILYTSITLREVSPCFGLPHKGTLPYLFLAEILHQCGKYKCLAHIPFPFRSSYKLKMVVDKIN